MGREGLLTLLPRKPNLLEEKEMCERVLLFLLSLPDSENHQGIKIPETQHEAHAEAEHWDSDLPLSPAKLCCCSTVESSKLPRCHPEVDRGTLKASETNLPGNSNCLK